MDIDAALADIRSGVNRIIPALQKIVEVSNNLDVVAKIAMGEAVAQLGRSTSHVSGEISGGLLGSMTDQLEDISKSQESTTMKTEHYGRVVSQLEELEKDVSTTNINEESFRQKWEDYPMFVLRDGYIAESTYREEKIVQDAIASDATPHDNVGSDCAGGEGQCSPSNRERVLNQYKPNNPGREGIKMFERFNTGGMFATMGRQLACSFADYVGPPCCLAGPSCSPSGNCELHVGTAGHMPPFLKASGKCSNTGKPCDFKVSGGSSPQCDYKRGGSCTFEPAPSGRKCRSTNDCHKGPLGSPLGLTDMNFGSCVKNTCEGDNSIACNTDADCVLCKASAKALKFNMLSVGADDTVKTDGTPNAFYVTTDEGKPVEPACFGFNEGSSIFIHNVNKLSTCKDGRCGGDGPVKNCTQNSDCKKGTTVLVDRKFRMNRGVAHGPTNNGFVIRTTPQWKLAPNRDFDCTDCTIRGYAVDAEFCVSAPSTSYCCSKENKCFKKTCGGLKDKNTCESTADCSSDTDYTCGEGTCSGTSVPCTVDTDCTSPCVAGECTAFPGLVCTSNAACQKSCIRRCISPKDKTDSRVCTGPKDCIQSSRVCKVSPLLYEGVCSQGFKKSCEDDSDCRDADGYCHNNGIATASDCDLVKKYLGATEHSWSSCICSENNCGACTTKKTSDAAKCIWNPGVCQAGTCGSRKCTDDSECGWSTQPAGRLKQSSGCVCKVWGGNLSDQACARARSSTWSKLEGDNGTCNVWGASVTSQSFCADLASSIGGVGKFATESQTCSITGFQDCSKHPSEVNKYATKDFRGVCAVKINDLRTSCNTDTDCGSRGACVPWLNQDCQGESTGNRVDTMNYSCDEACNPQYFFPTCTDNICMNGAKLGESCNTASDCTVDPGDILAYNSCCAGGGVSFNSEGSIVPNGAPTLLPSPQASCSTLGISTQMDGSSNPADQPGGCTKLAKIAGLCDPIDNGLRWTPLMLGVMSAVVILILVVIPCAIGIFYGVRFIMKQKLKKNGTCASFMCSPCKSTTTCSPITDYRTYDLWRNSGPHKGVRFKTKTCMDLQQFCPKIK